MDEDGHAATPAAARRQDRHGRPERREQRKQQRLTVESILATLFLTSFLNKLSLTNLI